MIVARIPEFKPRKYINPNWTPCSILQVLFYLDLRLRSRYFVELEPEEMFKIM